MATLHWLGFPPERHDLTQALLAMLGEDDAVVFLDAGLAFLQHQRGLTPFTGVKRYCLGAASMGDAKPITYAELAALSLHYHNSITWYP